MSWSSKADEQLRKALMKFFNEEVVVSKYAVSDAKELMMSYVDALKVGLQDEKCREDFIFEVGAPIFCGSAVEGTQSRYTEFDVDFPLHLDAKDWDCLKVTDFDTNYGPYICYMKKGRYSDEDEILLEYDVENNGTIDPVEVKKAFQEQVTYILESDSDEHYPETEWEIEESDTSPALTIQVYDSIDDEDLSFAINIAPVLHIKKQNGDEVYLAPKEADGYWRRSYAKLENDLIKTMDDEDNGCRKTVLRILKALAYESTGKRSFPDSYVLKNAIMHLREICTDDWDQANVATCFKRVLKYLEDCFREGVILRFFEPKHNLLYNYDVDVLNYKARFLDFVRQYDHYIRLLEL